MKLKELRLSTRIIISALIIVAASAALLAVAENNRLHDAYISEKRAHLKSDLEAEVARLSQAIETLRQDVLFLSDTPPVSGIVRAALNRGYDPHFGISGRVWEYRLAETFSAFSRAHPNYFQIRLIGVDEGGRELVRVASYAGSIENTPRARLQSKGDRDYFKATLGLRRGRVQLSEFDFAQEWNVSELMRRPTLRASTPVFTPSGKIFGMVVINLDVTGFLNSAAKNLPAGTQAYITDMTGQFLLHPEPQKTFAPGTGSENGITTYFPILKTMFTLQAPDHLPLQAAKGSTGTAWVTAKRFHFDVNDPSRFLLLFYAIPSDVAARQIPTIPAQNITAGAIAMLLIGLIALIGLRRTFYPLEEITVAADRIAAGDHNVQLPDSSGGEIGSLTEALNSMLTQLSQRERSLLESEAKYRRLHESMMDAFVMVDMSGRLVEFNHAFQGMLGYSVEELSRMSYVDLAPERWRGFEKRIVREHVFLYGHSPVYEMEYTRKNGTTFPVEIKAYLLRNKNNQPEAIWAIVRDITGRKLAQLELQHKQDMLKEAQRLGQLGSWELNFASGELQWTDEVYRIFELDPARFSPSYENFLNVIHPDDRDKVNQAYAQSLEKRQPYDVVHRLRFADGRIKWVREHCKSEFDATGKPLRSVGAVQDITRQKLSEEAIAKAGEKFRILFESISDAIFIHDMEGRFLKVNPSACDRLGYSEEELLQMGPRDIDSPEYAAKAPGRFKEIQEQGKLIFESAHVCKDGTVIPIELSAQVVDFDGQAVVLSVARDITARKRAEEELQRFFNLLPDLACIASTEGHFLKINAAAWQAILGFTEQELLGNPFLNFIHPDDRDRTIEEVERQMAGEKTMFFVNRYRCKDGGYKWLEWLTTPAVDKGLLYAVARDITDRKRDEEALQQSSARIEMLLNSVAEGIYGVDMRGNCTFVNPAALKLLGFQDETELLGKQMHDLIHHTRPDGSHYPAIECRLYHSLRTQQDVHHDDELFWRKDGSSFPVDYWSRPTVLNGEKGAVITFLDITKRKQAEERARKAADEIADLYNHAPCGYHSLDRDGNVRLINDTELSWLGYARDEVVGKMRWQNLLTPESLQIFKKSYPQFIQQGAVSGIEIDIVRKNGTTFTGLVNASAIYDRDGNFVMSRSMLIDITERKRVKRQLQELSSHLQTVREEEKANVAREIHDDLGGTLTALKIETFRLENDLSAKKAAPPVLKRVKSISQLLDSAVNVTRRVITELRPTILDDLGLLAALEWQASQFQKHTGIKCRVNCIEDKRTLNRQYSIALFRIFQESLTNVARHSGASAVEVEFHCDEEEVMLTISDNGHGLPKDHEVASNSFGLRGMRERVEQLGGNISFASKPKRGFVVSITLPLPIESIKEEQT